MVGTNVERDQPTMALHMLSAAGISLRYIDACTGKGPFFGDQAERAQKMGDRIRANPDSLPDDWKAWANGGCKGYHPPIV